VKSEQPDLPASALLEDEAERTLARHAQAAYGHSSYPGEESGAAFEALPSGTTGQPWRPVEIWARIDLNTSAPDRGRYGWREAFRLHKEDDWNYAASGVTSTGARFGTKDDTPIVPVDQGVIGGIASTPTGLARDWARYTHGQIVRAVLVEGGDYYHGFTDGSVRASTYNRPSWSGSGTEDLIPKGHGVALLADSYSGLICHPTGGLGVGGNLFQNPQANVNLAVLPADADTLTWYNRLVAPPVEDYPDPDAYPYPGQLAGGVSGNEQLWYGIKRFRHKLLALDGVVFGQHKNLSLVREDPLAVGTPPYESPITGISNANPCVVSYGGFGVGGPPFASGDVVRIYGVQGMRQINGDTQSPAGRYTVTGLVAGGLTLGVDSTTWDRYTGGGVIRRERRLADCGRSIRNGGRIWWTSGATAPLGMEVYTGGALLYSGFTGSFDVQGQPTGTPGSSYGTYTVLFKGGWCTGITLVGPPAPITTLDAGTFP